jgi:hypothetical protein
MSAFARAATPDPRRAGRRGMLLLLPTAALLLLLGCQSLGLTLLSRGSKPEEKEEPPQPPPLKTITGAPGKYSFRLAPYVFLSDFELKRDHPVFQDLAGLRDQVYRELNLPPGTAFVQVYLFEDRDRYERFLKARHPLLPARRAFFVAEPRGFNGEDLLVYTFWGERIHQDLRHELTHALLHSVIKTVPLWLDEGLAEYFELPAENQGVNPSHVRHLARPEFKPELVRLEGLKDVTDMNPAEYRESWAWVHFLLRGKPEGRAALLAYLQELRVSPSPTPLSARLAPLYTAPEASLKQHLTALDGEARPQAAAPK